MEFQRRLYRVICSALCILLSATTIDSSFLPTCLLFATASLQPSSKPFTRGCSFLNKSAVNLEEKTAIPAGDTNGSSNLDKLNIPVPKGGALDEVPVSENETTINSTTDTPSDQETKQEIKKGGPLKILFMSADTGGGHRASAESLANQFMRHYPGSEYDLVDVWTPTNVFPFKHLVPAYKRWAAHPLEWKLFYHITNTFPSEFASDLYTKLRCARKIKRQMEKYDPDVVISVHPTMNMLPMRITRKIAKERGKYVPFFTVVTDFGSGHCTWFTRNIDKMYIASDRIRRLARIRGLTPNSKLEMSGLPIRQDFEVQAEKMGERYSKSGIRYCEAMKKKLGLDPKRKNILVMGGGEGVGSLSTICEALYKQLKNEGVDATICVVCGRNEKLKEELMTKDWDALDTTIKPSKRQRGKKILRKLLLRKAKNVRALKTDCPKGNVSVVGLGFVTNMAEYMVATDVLVTKAGPGTIAEAASLGLPIMITSFLPGQEAGNVDIVVEAEFGLYRKYANEIASTAADWMNDDALLVKMSQNSARVGNPHAASDIVLDIGAITHEWLEKNKAAK